MSKALRYLGLVAILLAANVCVANGSMEEWGKLAPRITRLTSDGRSYIRRGLGFSPTGRYISFYRDESRGFIGEGGQKRQLMVRSEDGQEEYIVSRLGAPYTASWSPDAKKLAYIFSEGWGDTSEAQAYVWSLETRKSVRVGPSFERHKFRCGYSIPVWSPDSRYFVCQIRRVSDPQAWRFAPWVFATDRSDLAPKNESRCSVSI